MFSLSRRCLLVAGLKLSEGIHAHKKGMEEDPPDRIDWRERGAVTAVRNQKDYDCCWAIAAVGSVEALHKIETGQLVELSVQQVIDCDIHSSGCAGGSFGKAFRHILTYGITTEKAYPLALEKYSPEKPLPDMLSRLKKCERRRVMRQVMGKPVVHISDYMPVQPNEEALKRAVRINPVAVTIHPNQFFRDYKGGIIRLEDCPPPSLEEVESENYAGHAVLVIGYDQTPDGTKYWICKNSWGENWGENGFFRLERGVENAWGVCGIHRTYGAYPVGYYVHTPSFASTFKELKDLFSFYLASILRKSIATNDQYGRVNSESLFNSFGTILLDLLRGKNSMVLMDSCLEGHVSSSDGTDMMRLLVHWLQSEARDWPNLKAVVPALANLQKDAYLDLDYLHDRFGLNIGSASSPLVELATTVGTTELAVGDEVGLDSTSASVAKYNLGLGYDKHDLSIALLLSGKGNLCQHDWSPKSCAIPFAYYDPEVPSRFGLAIALEA